MLDSFFGPNTSFTINSTSPGVTTTRSFTGFDQAANEAAMSRIYGGIHFYASVEDGFVAGTALGQYVAGIFADHSDTLHLRADRHIRDAAESNDCRQ